VLIPLLSGLLNDRTVRFLDIAIQKPAVFGMNGCFSFCGAVDGVGRLLCRICEPRRRLTSALGSTGSSEQISQMTALRRTADLRHAIEAALLKRFELWIREDAEGAGMCMSGLRDWPTPSLGQRSSSARMLAAEQGN